ncbi:hypothetical protein [Actinophytocola sp.]|uniref:hypothetical protein n=1 Tax=Actinophytocola sp. TaxID=1872138 RepID=UPI002D7F428C|nr:hypothetical protein [Actinophytocola sp.]HET9140348.1 hypothetical protein [Actinophytocola sp.]
MPERTATTARRGRVALAWLLTNLAIGYLLAFPLLLVVVYSYYVRATVWGTVSSPFRDGEADVGVFVILITAVPLAVAAVAVNRLLRRRWGLTGRAAAAFWTGTVLLLFGPFTAFALSDLTVPQMLGRGLLW